MNLTSIIFFFFLIVSAIVYYIFPLRFRWIILLISSLVFFCSAGNWWLIGYLLLSVCATYFATILFKRQNLKVRKVGLVFALTIIIGVLFILKYYNLIPLLFNAINNFINSDRTIPMLSLLAPIGISYYSLSLISYLLDAYWGSVEVQKNPFKLLLFASFFPVLTSGPIMRYGQMKDELYLGKKLDYDNVYKGIARIIFGLAKKMIIADSLALVVREIFNNIDVYQGFWIAVGAAAYAIRIYMDFSGCMDIIIGAAKLFGITVPENFNAPFFSKNLSEFWRRWHISLGEFGKDYIMYPILKSSHFQKLSLGSRKIFGKNFGKKVPTIIAVLILWLLIGIWHGSSFLLIFAAGIIPWIYFTFSQVFDNFFKKLTLRLHINTKAMSWRVFQSIRTFTAMCCLWLVVCANSLSNLFPVIKSLFHFGNISLISSLPHDTPFKLIAFLCLVVFVVDYLKYKGYDVLTLWRQQNWCFKFASLLILCVLILIFGIWGPGYSASEFIYGGF